MELKELNEKIDVIETSPIRQYLKNSDKISLFEDEKIELRDIDKIININKENLHNPLKIVVLGEVKAGKSTLVNALVGKKVSYTNVVEATAAILEIKYSKEEKIIIKKKNEEVINLYSLGELDNLMNVNRDNQEFFSEINKISVFTNTERLKEITVVDTPGLNTVTSENEERTEDYIANADVILWILNSHHLGQSDISEKIEEVLDYGKPIICVLNRIDEINGDIREVVEYVQNEMGYMFSEIFATSAKLAWDGYIEKDSAKVKESHIDELYEYIVNNIEKNAKQVQKASILESMKVQIMRDLQVHKNTKLKIEGILGSFENDLRELKQFNNTIKEIVKNKISEWIDIKFFEEEKQLIIDCGDKELTNLIRKYSSDEYIHNLINCEYEELNNYILDEWTNNTEQFIKKQKQGEMEMTSIVNPYSIIGTENTQSGNDIIEGVKQGGFTAGAVGLGLAGYAAWLGPAAAYVSIGSAVSAFFPPLLIAGAIGGAVWKLASKDKNKVNRYNQIDALVFEIKSNIKSKVISTMKDNLYKASEYYCKNSELMIMSILQQCNTSKEEIEKISTELEKYIAVVGVNISEEINNEYGKNTVAVYNENITEDDNTLSFEMAMDNVISIAEESSSFLQFVSEIQEPSLKLFFEGQYETFKASNKFESVHLGENGCIEFAGALLLFTYSCVRNDSMAINGCNQAFIMAFKGAPAEIFSSVMDDIINEETNIPYEDWSAVYRYLRDNHGNWIRKFEFAGAYTMSDHQKYKKMHI